ncbi:MAG: ketopantoate reductase family protein [Candidatus Bathyarchaeota archaeon]|nr:ketopantoate reductase family protein [Candidatus Bathyarchaeota archaeon]
MTTEASDFTKVIVMGAGAIGSYYGSMLSRKTDVLLISRRGHMDAVNSRGLEVTGAVEGTFDLDASTELGSIPGGSLIILTTKAYDIEEAVNEFRALLKPDTVILVLQNGLGNEDLVQSIVGPEVDVVRGLASTGVEFLSPGRIEVKLVRETVLPKTAVGEKIGRLFDLCGLGVQLSERMDVEVWRKLTMNCVINPLTALFRVPNTEIAVEGLREVRKGIVDECIRIAQKEGVILEGDLEGEISRAAASYSNISSMCQDIMKGRRTEIGFLNGKVSELGRRHGVATPVNDVLTSLIRFMEGKE